MDFIKNIADLPVIIKRYIRENKLKRNTLAMKIDKDPSYLSRILNGKNPIPVELLLKVLHSMGYELVIMTKKEKNLLERGAYAELSKDLPNIREEIRAGVVNELEDDLIRKISEVLREKK